MVQTWTYSAVGEFLEGSLFQRDPIYEGMKLDFSKNVVGNFEGFPLVILLMAEILHHLIW